MPGLLGVMLEELDKGVQGTAVRRGDVSREGIRGEPAQCRELLGLGGEGAGELPTEVVDAYNGHFVAVGIGVEHVLAGEGTEELWAASHEAGSRRAAASTSSPSSTQPPCIPRQPLSLRRCSRSWPF